MVEIPQYRIYNEERHIAILDNSSIAFLESVDKYGVCTSKILQDYDVVLIPTWVWKEVEVSDYRLNYIESLLNSQIPICLVRETLYSTLARGEEGHLFRIVKASANCLSEVLRYLRMNVETDDVLDIPEAEVWLRNLYDNWPLKSSAGNEDIQRELKPNAGEISITILALTLSSYYPGIEALTIYSQDKDTYRFHENARRNLEKDSGFFLNKIPPVGYKSNDALLQQFLVKNMLKLEEIDKIRKDLRAVCYSKKQGDCSAYLTTEKLDNEHFLELIKDENVHIIF